MQWNEHPLIQSKDVSMEADLEIGKSWDKQTSIPNNASISQIKKIIEEINNVK
jgi:thymidylate synthase